MTELEQARADFITYSKHYEKVKEDGKKLIGEVRITCWTNHWFQFVRSRDNYNQARDNLLKLEIENILATKISI